MKPYEEVCFPSGIIRWIREGDEYVCRLTEDQINEIKEIHEDPPKQLELPLVRVEEFVELIKGNEGVFGRPVMRTEWPTEEKPWVKTYSDGKPNYTQPIEREPYPENFIDALRFDAAQSEPVIQARKEGDLIVADLPQVPRGSGGITKDEQPEPKPVAWISHNAGLYHGKPDESLNPLPLYTAPPKKEWVGLTKEELAEIAEFHFHGAFSGRDFYDDVEAKLKEKNT